ncbi:hypothetical protein [Sphingomonas sp. 10B4]|uniref:hypothetical protein n=1 Tax=Sphingomonas sp. 10B4 TaxID=3048575 RepID=UPI002AB3E47C|nr:hypothetical protein [Sphingomonas sp. 10B4]MDY7525978.1 hypothetical protein [Sphingomonas sp. 10B4]MEB0283160.1 hypothetical protein [Sphingomonas sp. 10B4]
MYKITVDRGHALVKIEMRAMLDVADSARLVSELIAQITDARLASYALILDIAQCPIQSQEMIAAMGEHLTKMQRVRAIAIVTGAMLARLQVRRIFSQPFNRFTSTYDEALRWVLSGVEPGGASTPG